MDDIKILNEKGLLEIKMPTCLADQPAFTRRVNSIRNAFARRFTEEEYYIRDRLWFRFTLER